MSKSEGTGSGSPVEASEAGAVSLDMDFIKSFLDKTNEEQDDSKNSRSDSPVEGEESENKDAKDNEAERTREQELDEQQNQQPLKKRRRKKKVIKRKPPVIPKPDAQSSEDQKEDLKEDEKKAVPVPKLRKSIQRPASAPRQRLSNRPSSAPRHRDNTLPLSNDSTRVDFDLESIEQVERQNQTTQSILVRSPRLKSAKKKSRPQSASKYESLKRVTELSKDSLHGEGQQNSECDDENQTGVRFNKSTKDSENVELRKQKLRFRAPPPSSLSHGTYEYHDYHSAPLEKKYEELRLLCDKKYHETRVKDQDNPEVVTYAKGMLRKYGVKVEEPAAAASFQKHVFTNPAVHPTTAENIASSDYSRRRGWARSSNQKGSIVIDVSREVDGKHVKFVGGDGESVDSTSLDQDSEDILTVEREIALQSLNSSNATSSILRSRQSQKPPTRNNQLSRSKTPDSANSSLSRSGSRSRSGSGGRFWSTDTSGSDSSPSRSPVRMVPTVCDLSKSDNTKILQWLKKKNREIRKKKREERKKIKQEQKEQDETLKSKEERQEKSEKRVAAWMTLKKKETRLLRRKQRNPHVLQIAKSDNSLKFGGKVEGTEEVTVGNVETRENMVADGKEKEETDVSCQGAGKQGQPTVKGRMSSQNRPASAKSTKCVHMDTNMKGQEGTASCTCGYVKTQRLKEEELKQARLAAKMRALEAKRARQAEKAKRELLKPTPANVAFSEEPSQSGNLPDISKSQGFKGKKLKNKGDEKVAADSVSAAEKAKQQRQSYDNWLKKKREEHRKKQQEERRKKEELAESMDEEDKGVVQKVARKRIDNILQGKKRIDTGVEQIDAAANATVEERIQAKKEVKNKTTDPGNVTTPAADKNTESNGIFLTEEPSNPKYVLPEGDKEESASPPKDKQRPSSARPSSAKTTKAKRSRPTRPASAKPDVNRPSSRADKVTDKHPNPFKLPQPPAPRRHSPSPPRPKVKVTPAYKNVKYQQKSWEDFSEFVWDKVNNDVEEEYQKHERPEPMGSDNPDEELKKSLDTNSEKKISLDHKSENEVSDGPQVEQETDTKVPSSPRGESAEIQEINTDSESDIKAEEKQTDADVNDASGDGDAYADDFEDETTSVPSINIEPPSPEVGIEFEESANEPDKPEESSTNNDKEEAHSWNEDDQELWKEVQETFNQDEKERKEWRDLQDGDDHSGDSEPTGKLTPDMDEVDHAPTETSPVDLPVETPLKKKTKGKPEKSVRFSEEIQTQEFVYPKEYDDGDDYDDSTNDQGNSASFGVANEQIEFDVSLQLDGSEGGSMEKEEKSEPSDVEAGPNDEAMPGSDAVSFMMQGILDSATQNVSSLKMKKD